MGITHRSTQRDVVEAMGWGEAELKTFKAEMKLIFEQHDIPLEHEWFNVNLQEKDKMLQRAEERWKIQKPSDLEDAELLERFREAVEWRMRTVFMSKKKLAQPRRV